MSIVGNFKTMELAGLLQWVGQGRKSGTLVIKNQHTEKRLVFEKGILISTFSTNPHEHLCRFLLDRRLVDQVRLKAALKQNRGNSLQLGCTLVTSGELTPAMLNEVLELRAEETVRDLFEWTEGDFQFLDGERPRSLPVEISIEVTALLLRVADRIDRRRAEGARRGSVKDNASPPPTHGQLALVPGADPVTDELPVIRMPSAVPDPDTGSVEAAHGERASAAGVPPLAVVAGVLASLVLVSGLFFLLGRDQAGAADTAATGPVPATQSAAVAELEAKLAAIEGEMESTLSEQAETVEASLRAEHERQVAELQRALEAARSVAVTGETVTEEAVTESAAIEAAVTAVSAGQSVAATGPAGERIAAAPPPSSPVAIAGDERVEEPVGLEANTVSPPTISPLALEAAAAEEVADSDAATTEPVAPPAPQRADADAAPASGPAAAYVARSGRAVAVPGPGVVPPRVTRRPTPRYPPLARRMGRSAEVTVEVLVGLNGRPEEVRSVGEAIGLGFDAAALSAARGSRWEPARVDGEPARMWAKLKVAFKAGR